MSKCGLHKIFDSAINIGTSRDEDRVFPARFSHESDLWFPLRKHLCRFKTTREDDCVDA